MLNVKVWTLTLAAWFGVTFVLCVAWCGIAPDGWHVREFLELVLPGFEWLTFGSFVLGLTESVATGAYSGALVAWLHNRIAGWSLQRAAHATT